MNKKLTHKKVNIFGKKVSVLVIASIIVLGFVAAALIPYFGIITGSVTASQGLLVDNFTYSDGPITDTYPAITSLQSATYVKPHELENEADIQAQGNLTSTCTSTDSCADVDYRAVEYFDNAGADFSGYTTPSTCDVTVSGSIQTAIDSATSGQVVCVPAGTYAEDVNVNKDITLVALTSPDSGTPVEVTGSGSTAEGIITINSAGAIVKGFLVDPTSGSFANKKAGIQDYYGNTVIDSNIVRNLAGIGTSINAIYLYNVAGASDFTVTNNLAESITNTGRGANGIMIQGTLDSVSVMYNTIKDITTDNSSGVTWDYAMAIQDTPSSGHTGGPTNLDIEYNTFDNIVTDGASESGRGFGVDEVDIFTNWADASEVTLKYNNFLNIANDLTNKDNDNHTLVAQDNYFDELAYNVNGASKDEIYPINADWMTKTTFDIAPHKRDQFATLASFPKMLAPDTFTVKTTVTA